MSEENRLEKNTRIVLHFKYFAAIAIITIILISTERWSSSKEFTTYLSNAATMTSLFVGVIAIFYSFVSNDSLSRSLGSIFTITNEVKEAKDDIKKSVILTQDAIKASEINTEKINSASLVIEKSLPNLDATLAVLGTQNRNLQELLSNIPTRIDQLESKVGNVAKAIGEKPMQSASTEGSSLNDSVIESFLKMCSLSHNLLLIACSIANDKNAELDINKFTDAIEWQAPNQIQGFLRCMHSLKICKVHEVESKQKVYTISNTHSHLKERARPYFTTYILEHQTGTDLETWQRRLANTEKIFEDNSEAV